MMNHENLPHVYVPVTGIEYPEKPDQPILFPKKLREVVIDEHYPYLDKSFFARLRHVAIYLGIFVLVFPVQKVRYGLKIEGRENIRKNKKLFANGALTVCNHVYRWDFLACLQAVRWRRMWFPARPDNLEGSDAGLIRGAGGIPIPTGLAASRKFNEAFDQLHAKKKWIHLFQNLVGGIIISLFALLKKVLFLWLFAIRYLCSPLLFPSGKQLESVNC